MTDKEIIALLGEPDEVTVSITSIWHTKKTEIPIDPIDPVDPVDPVDPGNDYTVIEQFGLKATFAGEYTTSSHVDGTPYIIADGNGDVVLERVELSSGVVTDTYVGNVMVDPSSKTHQGFDSRLNTGSRGPGLTYREELAAAILPASGGALSSPLVVNVTGATAKTICLYRGSNTVTSGGESTGCYARCDITVYPSNPGTDPIKPASLFVAGGKPCYTKSDIDFDLYPPIVLTAPMLAAEPVWDTDDNRLKWPLVRMGSTVNSAFISPLFTQNEFNNGTQGASILKVCLGAISDIADREELICRVVRDGLEVDAAVKLGMTCMVCNGGFGVGGKILRYLAGKWLGDAPMLGRPPQVYDSGSDSAATDGMVPFFHEDGAVSVGVTRAIYGNTRQSTWPNRPFSDNHDSRDPDGVADPHWVWAITGNAQAAGSDAYHIQLAASTTMVLDAGDRIRIVSGTASGTLVTVRHWNKTTKVALVNPDPATALSSNSGDTAAATSTTITLASNTSPGISTSGTDHIFITSGTGAGQGSTITGWDAGTKIATVGPAWVTIPVAGDDYTIRRGTLWTRAPDATSVYEVYNGGTYNADMTKGGMMQTALVLKLIGEEHDTDDWADEFMEYCQRWIDDNGLMDHYPVTAQGTSADARIWFDTSEWTKGFYKLSGPLWERVA